MKMQLLTTSQITSKKTGEIRYNAVCLGTFNSYGQTEPATIKLKLTSEQFMELSKNQGKMIDFDFEMPLPTFPIALNTFKVLP